MRKGRLFLHQLTLGKARRELLPGTMRFIEKQSKSVVKMCKSNGWKLAAGLLMLVSGAKAQLAPPQLLEHPFPQANADFGGHLSVSDRWLVVGARRNDLVVPPGGPGGVPQRLTEAGAVYIYERVNDEWKFSIKLQPPNLQANDQFGLDVAVDGNLLVVGSWVAPSPGNSNAGNVRIYEHTGPSWILRQTIVNPESSTRSFFGRGVAVSNGRVAVGASGGTGAVFVYDPTPGANLWAQTARLEPMASDGTIITRNAGSFGEEVALDGSVLIVGASTWPRPNQAAAGAAFIYERLESRDGVSWRPSGILPGVVEARDRMGFAVDVSGDMAVVSKPRVGADIGEVDVFQRTPGSAVDWQVVATLQASDRENFDFFGHSVAIRGDRVLVGAHNAESGPNLQNSGTGYLFEKNAQGTFVETEILRPTTEGPSNFLGVAAGLTDTLAVLGANGRNGSGAFRAGAAYSYTLEAAPAVADEITNITVNLATREVRLTWTADPNQHWAFFRSFDLENWTRFTPDSFAGSATARTTTLGNGVSNDGETKGFFELRAVPNNSLILMDKQ